MLSPTKNKDTPIDHFNLVNIIALVLGTGTLLAYNVMITCSDYLNHEFEQYPDIMFTLVPVLCIPNFLGMVFMIRFGHEFSWTVKITSTFICIFIILVCIPCIVSYSRSRLSETDGYIILLILSGIIGLLTAILQCSVIAFISLLPSKYIQTGLSGQAVSGIIVCLIRILTKLLFTKTDNDIIIGGLIYFIVGSIITAICAMSFILLKKMAFVKYHLNINDNNDNNDNSEQEKILKLTENDSNMNIKNDRNVSNVINHEKLKMDDNYNGTSHTTHVKSKQQLERMDTFHALAKQVIVNEAVQTIQHDSKTRYVVLSLISFFLLFCLFFVLSNIICVLDILFAQLLGTRDMLFFVFFVFFVFLLFKQ